MDETPPRCVWVRCEGSATKTVKITWKVGKRVTAARGLIRPRRKSLANLFHFPPRKSVSMWRPTSTSREKSINWQFNYDRASRQASVDRKILPSQRSRFFARQFQTTLWEMWTRLTGLLAVTEILFLQRPCSVKLIWWHNRRPCNHCQLSLPASIRRFLLDGGRG